VSLRAEAAREKIASSLPTDAHKPFMDRCPGLPGDFELNRTTGLLLDYRRTVPNLPFDLDIADLHPHKITTSKLAIDGQVK
jgi:hypothetical protein